MGNSNNVAGSGKPHTAQKQINVIHFANVCDFNFHVFQHKYVSIQSGGTAIATRRPMLHVALVVVVVFSLMLCCAKHKRPLPFLDRQPKHQIPPTLYRRLVRWFVKWPGSSAY